MSKQISTIKEIVKAYNLLVRNIDDKASNDEIDRAYGGIIRAGKGALVESIAKHLIQIAWKNLGGDIRRLSFERKSIKIPIKDRYINKLQSEEIRQYIRKNIDNYYYLLRTDVQAWIDEELIVGIECKAYTENAMFKRIMVDFTFLKSVYPNANCVLLQLESQLGGDYSEVFNEIIYGSCPTHTIMSYFDVDLLIVTLLEGERKVDEPIHKQEFFKELKEKSVENAVKFFEELLKKKI